MGWRGHPFWFSLEGKQEKKAIGNAKGLATKTFFAPRKIMGVVGRVYHQSDFGPQDTPPPSSTVKNRYLINSIN